jgi:mevalonate kinase
MSTGEACAKIIFFGEHAVVYGYPAIALPVKCLKTTVQVTKAAEYEARSSIPLDESKKAKLGLLYRFLKLRMGIKGNHTIEVSTDVPMGAGFGSSASLCVAMVRALSQLNGNELSPEAMNSYSFEAEKIFHGNPSGIDNTVVTYERPIFFQKGTAEMFPERKLILLAANSGPRPPTSEVVLDLRKRFDAGDADIVDGIMRIGEIIGMAKSAIMDEDFALLGDLMNQNHNILRKIGVSTEKLDLMCQAALENNAYGAKLSGSGRGGNMIALVDPGSVDRVREALRKFTKEIWVIG